MYYTTFRAPDPASSCLPWKQSDWASQDRLQMEYTYYTHILYILCNALQITISSIHCPTYSTWRRLHELHYST